MISSVRGIVLHVSGGGAVIEVGGVGMSIALTPEHALSLRVGSEAFVHTALIVREDDQAMRPGGQAHIAIQRDSGQLEPNGTGGG